MSERRKRDFKGYTAGHNCPCVSLNMHGGKQCKKRVLRKGNAGGIEHYDKCGKEAMCFDCRDSPFHYTSEDIRKKGLEDVYGI